MDNLDWLSWLYLGDGLKMYNEILQKDLKMNVIAFPASGETAEPQGWFKKPIVDVKTFKGLKFRAAGAASEVFKNLGMSVVVLPAVKSSRPSREALSMPANSAILRRT